MPHKAVVHLFLPPASFCQSHNSRLMATPSLYSYLIMLREIAIGRATAVLSAFGGYAAAAAAATILVARRFSKKINWPRKRLLLLLALPVWLSPCHTSA